MTTSQLAAVVIVRDEAAMLPACLESLAGVVDEVHVHDTGSSDDSPGIAERSGAAVTHGDWADDFAAARNEAVAGVTAEWVLAVDADHRVTADAAALRRTLDRAEADAMLVEVDDAHHADPYRQVETRLYRPAVLRWQGRVHERLIRPDGTMPERSAVPAGALRLLHLGHATHADRVRRSERNLALAHRMIDELAADPADREPIAAALLALGRDCAAADRWQQATDTYEMLRELFPGTPEWMQATDGLARLVLASGYDRLCLVLVGQLREAGAAPGYCDWLEAQALAQLGYPHQAGELLAGLTEVIDTTGRRHEPRALREIADLVEQLRILAPLP